MNQTKVNPIEFSCSFRRAKMFLSCPDWKSLVISCELPSILTTSRSYNSYISTNILKISTKRQEEVHLRPSFSLVNR